jgi:hypothetical protein
MQRSYIFLSSGHVQPKFLSSWFSALCGSFFGSWDWLSKSTFSLKPDSTGVLSLILISTHFIGYSLANDGIESYDSSLERAIISNINELDHLERGRVVAQTRFPLRKKTLPPHNPTDTDGKKEIQTLRIIVAENSKRKFCTGLTAIRTRGLVWILEWKSSMILWSSDSPLARLKSKP